MKKYLLWGGLILLLVIVGVRLVRVQYGGLDQAERAPDFTLTTFEGETYRLSDLRGKVVVINFWASWCEACKLEAAELEQAWQIYQPGGEVIFLGVDYVDTEPEAQRYLDEFDITYPNGPDLRTEISQDFQIRGVPDTYVIDRAGVIVHKQYGPFPSLEEILTAVDQALNK